MDTPSVYLPMDRRLALARGESLPERVHGSVLFADISGFTPLTEALARELGARRGAEELTRHLNRVYNAVIAELHRYGGSVIGFSGDAITCWLDGDDGRRAVASSLAMQGAMAQFAQVRTYSGQTVSLGMKAAVAVGPVRRFAVGDQEHVILDVLAGRTLERLAAAEHQAERGEVVVDETTARNLGDLLQVVEERRDETGAVFTVVAGLNVDVPETPWPALPEEAYPSEAVRGWLLPPVFDRLVSGQGEFLAELRPTVAVFLRFGGINYDDDEEAPQKLDQFVRQVEEILGRYDGSLIQLTVGDKGSYLYITFGAPVAHEEDAERAASAALEMRSAAAELAYLDAVQIGITTGRMRTGAYGSDTRRSYGALGDATNLSARLMSAARPGQILVSDEAQAVTGDSFVWERLPNIRVKGKSDPVELWQLVDRQRRSGSQGQGPAYSLPMVGRQEELELIGEKLALARAGKGQIVGIAAEAGMGKSRLAAEVITQAHRDGFTSYAGECQSYGTGVGYLVWGSIWRGLFGLEPGRPLEEVTAALEQKLREVDPALVRRLPLLGPLLNLPIPDNELTRSLEAKIRKTSLEAMLVTCFENICGSQPVLLVLEDAHWIDPLSADLVVETGRAIADLPVMMLMPYRSLDEVAETGARIRRMPYFTEVALTEFGQEEAEQLIRLKLAQFFGSEGELPPGLLSQVTARAAGNPYYIEELLNLLRDRGIDPADTEALAEIDLPSSLYSLILTRIDQLSERQNATLKVASVIGRYFRAAMVWGVYPELGEKGQVWANLDRLSGLDLTPMDTPEPELAYLFKHVIIQEVAYESLLYATRAMLHERIGSYIEERYAERLDQFLSLLAHHYGRSENLDKKREYLLQAGRASQAVYDNEAAIRFFKEALTLLPDEEKLEVYLELGKVLELVGRWAESETIYSEALELAESQSDRHAAATYQEAMAELARKQGRYEEASEWVEKARIGFDSLGDRNGMALALGRAGIITMQRGDVDTARRLMEQSLDIYRRTQESAKTASMLSNLSIVARHQRDRERAQYLQQEALSIRKNLGDPWLIAISLINLGNITSDQGQLDDAQSYLQEALKLLREVGDPSMIGNAAHNLGNVLRGQDDLAAAKMLYDECLAIYQRLGDKLALAQLFEDMGSLAARGGQSRRALVLVGAAERLRQEIKAPITSIEASALDTALAKTRAKMSEEERAQYQTEGQSLLAAEAAEFARSGRDGL